MAARVFPSRTPVPTATRNAFGPRPASAGLFLGAAVIDGDTLEIHGQRIRLHGMDAPESCQLCRLDGKPWQCGKDAANVLTAALISLCLR